MKKVISFLFILTSFNAYSQESFIQPQHWYFSVSGGASVTVSESDLYYDKDQHGPSYNAELLYALSRRIGLGINYNNNTSGTSERKYKNVSYTAVLRFNFPNKLFTEAGLGLYDIDFIKQYPEAFTHEVHEVNMYSGISFGAGAVVNLTDNINLLTRLRVHIITNESYDFLTLNTGLMFKNFEGNIKAENKAGYYAAVFSGVLNALAGNHKLAGAFGIEAGKQIREHIYLSTGIVYNNPSVAKFGNTVKERKYLEVYIGPMVYFGSKDVRMFIEPGFGYYRAKQSFEHTADTKDMESFGIYAGAGGETDISNNTGLFLILRYNNLLNLDNDNFASFHGGVKYNF
jgi:hypothetical protein